MGHPPGRAYADLVLRARTSIANVVPLSDVAMSSALVGLKWAEEILYPLRCRRQLMSAAIPSCSAALGSAIIGSR